MQVAEERVDLLALVMVDMVEEALEVTVGLALLGLQILEEAAVVMATVVAVAQAALVS